MIVATTGLVYFLLFPGDDKELAQSGLYAALSLGNVFFCLSTGYFEIPCESKGLLGRRRPSRCVCRIPNRQNCPALRSGLH